MYLAFAVEVNPHPRHQENYRVWFMRLNKYGKMTNIGIMSKKDLIQALFRSYREKGKSNWMALTKTSSQFSPIELIDFLAMSTHANTHFGELPTIAEFQKVLNQVQDQVSLSA